MIASKTPKKSTVLLEVENVSIKILARIGGKPIVQYIVNKVSTGVKNQSNLSLPLYFTRTYMYKKYPKGNTPKIVPISLGFAKPPNGVNTVGT